MAGRRKENDREELKLRVVETASKSFMTLGIKAVHMDDIASSLSISKRTLYELFGDKEELLLEVFRFYRHCMNEYMQEIASSANNVLEVILTFYERKFNELCSVSIVCGWYWRQYSKLLSVNPLFFRDLRKYSKVLGYIHDDRSRGDADALAYFQKGVEQGIFRSDINFQIINQAMAMQMDLLIYSDITDHYPLAEIYSEITILHMRGITTEKGYRMVDDFLKNIREKHLR